VWRVSDGSCVQTLEGPGDGIDWVAWHPKGDILLAGSEDFTMWMWLAQTGNCMQVRGVEESCFPGGWALLLACDGKYESGYGVCGVWFVVASGAGWGHP
jgi:WD40 repeat protein